MPILKITKANMPLMTPAPGSGGKQLDFYDTDIACFGVRATLKSKTFFVYRRVKGHPEKVYIPIGKYGLFTPEQARTVAKDYLRRMDQGENPHPKHAVRLKIITIKDLFLEYLDKRQNLTDATRTQYGLWYKNHLAKWGDLDATGITGSMVLDKLAAIDHTAGRTQATNTIKLLRTLFNFGLAVHPETIKSNPVAAVKALGLWAQPVRRKTHISHEDLPRWYRAVLNCDHPAARDYLLFLLFTGVRKSEAIRLQWSDIDLSAKTYSFVPEKKPQGADAAKVIMPLSDQLWLILKTRKEQFYETEFVWPGRGGHPHVSKPDHWVYLVKKASGVEFCCHDLRRNFVTVAEGLDIAHYSLKALLNHTLGNDVTGGYVCLTAERLREPTQRVVDRIMELVTSVKPTPT